MKRRIIVIIVVICLAAVFMPTVSYAAITPYFMAVNDTLLPFNDDTMPFVSGGVIYVPYKMFFDAGVWSVAAEDMERARLYRGNKGLDFYTSSGLTQDQNGNTLYWPAARRIGSRFYVPLYQVCEFFDLMTPQIIDIPSSIIPEEQMRVIRIRSAEGLNDPTFVGLNRDEIRAAYDAYFGPHIQPSPSDLPDNSPGETPSPPIEEPPETYQDVTIYISFNNISAGGSDVLLELLDANAESDYKFCFFVNEDDVNNDPGLIRRIYACGHTIGIWLKTGTVAEYKKTSALLFEAAKVKTVLASTGRISDNAMAALRAGGIVLWGAGQSLVYDDTLSVAEVTEMIPKESGARLNLMSSCSENAALMLSGILSYLRENEYTIERIKETVEPVGDAR